ncbi:DUF2062 domain-containing protein [Pseudohoeflea coraliihabitans]|uniref:DUF2062 domain-containing protein n=1 Tax=Pseudohoeflea coraliihabitans TaxID=2860393 RepID=A0ABS6WPG6_9HYPH|nr:DUF2062 domain-containing protein [Pseudohoeflea sp. DP4N28-3]MBW3097838.1 DUF2062 domain-containing protein [Pseudohoeflea sp. DP4N28-3]
MLFRRRRPLRFWGKLRIALWPSRSFSRSFQYFIKRVLRLTATPHAIAAGVAAGAFTSCTPLLGFHFLLSFALAYVIGGNLVAAALGTGFGNPLSFPFIWAATYKTGNFMIGVEGRRAGDHIDLYSLLRHMDMSQIWGPVLKPMLIGALPLGLVVGSIFYLVTYWSVKTFQLRRRTRLEEQARARLSRLSNGSPA